MEIDIWDTKATKFVKRWINVVDLNGSVILSVHTLVVIGISIASFILHRDISTPIITLFGMNLGSFLTHKTITNVATTNSASTTTTTEQSGPTTVPPAPPVTPA